MAIETSPARAGVQFRLPAEPSALSPYIPALEARSRVGKRLGDAAPLAISVFLISFIFWAPFHPATAALFAVSLLAFYVYWVVRSYSVAIACWVGLRRIGRWQRTDWPAKYAAWSQQRAYAEKWEWPRHLVIIPNYGKANRASPARSIRSPRSRTRSSSSSSWPWKTARPAAAAQGRPSDARATAAASATCSRPTTPPGSPDETPGKGSNEAWAAREAYIRLIEAARRRHHALHHHELRRRRRLPPAPLRGPELPLPHRRGTATARSGSPPSSTPTTSGTSRRRCASRTASPA